MPFCMACLNGKLAAARSTAARLEFSKAEKPHSYHISTLLLLINDKIDISPTHTRFIVWIQPARQSRCRTDIHASGASKEGSFAGNKRSSSSHGGCLSSRQGLVRQIASSEGHSL